MLPPPTTSVKQGHPRVANSFTGVIMGTGSGAAAFAVKECGFRSHTVAKRRSRKKLSSRDDPTRIPEDLSFTSFTE